MRRLSRVDKLRCDIVRHFDDVISFAIDLTPHPDFGSYSHRLAFLMLCRPIQRVDRTLHGGRMLLIDRSLLLMVIASLDHFRYLRGDSFPVSAIVAESVQSSTFTN